MRINSYKCDGCNKLIEGDVYQSALETINENGDYNSKDWTYSEELSNVHFCKECAHKVFVMICQFNNDDQKELPVQEQAQKEETKEEPKEEQKEEPKAKAKKEPKKAKKQPEKKHIDCDKAWALRKAGWSIKQIHEEFGVCLYDVKEIYKAVFNGKQREATKEMNESEDEM